MIGGGGGINEGKIGGAGKLGHLRVGNGLEEGGDR